ncbi:MAG: hypothetical protein M1608_10625 [Candidatus Omnitrophica bacterium]|nr:hypothetical protein [Candidatus Omnitrophota bacterium]
MKPELNHKPGIAEIQTAVERFNSRVDDAMRNKPPTKEWVRKAVRRQGADRCPVRLRRLSYDVILRYGDDLADLFCEYPDDLYCAQAYELFIGYQAPGRAHPIDPLHALTQSAQWTDEWGTGWAHAVGGVGASPISHPLKEWSQLDEYLAGHVPDPRAPGRLDGALPALNMHGQTKYFSGQTHLSLFERMHCLRGMANAFEDFYVYPKETSRLLDALTEYYLEIVRAWGRLDNVDGLFMTDDWGTQTALMISPDMWRKFFAGRYRRIGEEAHRCGLDLIFHSCGHVTEIIGDLIDAGVDVLDPLQPEAMDLKQIASKFGGHIAFFGGLSDQRLVTMSPTEVHDEVHRSIDTMGRAFRNAYIVAPSNILTPEIPLENIRALFEACHNQ